MASGEQDTTIYIQGAATDTAYFTPVPTPNTSPDPPGNDPFGVIYVAAGDGLSPNAGHPYFREAADGPTHDLLEPDIPILNTGTFITLANEPGLPQSRNLAVSPDLALADGGAQNPITIGLSPTNSARLATLGTASFITAASEVSLPQSRRLVAGTRITVTDGGALGPFTVSVNAATDTLLANLNNAGIVTVGASLLPNARSLIAGAGILITDLGAGLPVSISSTVVVPPVVGPAVHVMNFDFTDGVIPVPNALVINFTMYKVGRVVTAYMGAWSYNNVSLLGGSLITALGSEFPAAYLPSGANVLPANITQTGGGLPSMTTHRVTATGSMRLCWLGVLPWITSPGQVPGLSLTGGDLQTLTWFSAT